MYEELLPIWRERCKSVAAYPSEPHPEEWVDELRRRGLSWQFFYVPGEARFGHTNCLVQGVMLFTYELGVED